MSGSVSTAAVAADNQAGTGLAAAELPEPALEQALAQALATADPAGATPPAQACGAAREAMSLAARLRRPADATRAGTYLCQHLFRLGRHDLVLAEAPAHAQALALGPSDTAQTGARLELLRVLTLSACELARFDLALSSAQEAVRLALDLDERAALKSSFTLGVCFERMGDSWQAQRVLSQALQRHPEGGTPPSELVVMHNALCAICIGQFHRLDGVADAADIAAVLRQARAAAERAMALMGTHPDPLQEVAVCGNLGEVLLYQGEAQAAWALLLRSQARAVERGYAAYRWRLTTTMAVLELQQGQPQAALARMDELIQEMGAQPPQQTAIRAHHAAYRACRAMGRHEQALQHFETVERMERQRATDQLRAQSELFVTRTEAQQAQWHAEQARRDALMQRARAAEFAADAERDPLTGLGNRRHLDRRCEVLLPALQRYQEPVALAMLDVDHFKRVNDAHGHAVGDRVLQALATLLRENTRNRDVLARYGGEEFVIVLPGMTPEKAAEVCERLRERVAAHELWCPGLPQLRITISLGLVATVAPSDQQALLQAADAALYRAKRAGRNQICLQA